MASQPDLADDIVAETFLVAWRRLDDVPDDAGPWLFGVARNVRLNLQRSARRQQAVARKLTVAEPSSEPPEPRETPPLSGTRSPHSPSATAKSCCFMPGKASTGDR